MKAGNSITKQALQKSQPSSKQSVSFSDLINSPSWKSMIVKSLGDPDRAANFTSTLISIVSSNDQLKDCDQGSIISAALQGEAQKLSLALQQYSVVPYNEKGVMKARYQISYKGILQLAQRSGEYKKIKVRDVRKGEYKGVDRLTGDPIIDFLPDGERENLPLEGFYAYYILHNGFMNDLYWSHEKILNHANTYSQPFKGKKELYEQMNEGKVKRPESGSPWFAEPLSEPHMKMCRKTLILQLFRDGIAPLSIEMQRAFKREQVLESGGYFVSADDPSIIEANTVSEDQIVADVDAETGEILEPQTKGSKQMTIDDMTGKE